MRFALGQQQHPLQPLDKNNAEKAKIKVKSVQVVDEVEKQRCESGKIVHAKHTPTYTHVNECVMCMCVCVCVRCVNSLSVVSLVLGDFAICLLFPFQGVFQIIPPLTQHCQSGCECVCVCVCPDVFPIVTANFLCCTHCKCKQCQHVILCCTHSSLV